MPLPTWSDGASFSFVTSGLNINVNALTIPPNMVSTTSGGTLIWAIVLSAPVSQRFGLMSTTFIDSLGNSYQSSSVGTVISVPSKLASGRTEIYSNPAGYPFFFGELNGPNGFTLGGTLRILGSLQDFGDVNQTIDGSIVACLIDTSWQSPGTTPTVRSADSLVSRPPTATPPATSNLVGPGPDVGNVLTTPILTTLTTDGLYGTVTGTLSTGGVVEFANLPDWYTIIHRFDGGNRNVAIGTYEGVLGGGVDYNLARSAAQGYFQLFKTMHIASTGRPTAQFIH